MYSFTLLLFNFSIGVMCAVVAVVYRHILAYTPVLNWWFRLGFKYSQRRMSSVAQAIHKVVWECEMCQAGQLALWSYVYFTVTTGFYFAFIFGICWAILCARLLKDFLTKQ